MAVSQSKAVRKPKTRHKPWKCLRFRGWCPPRGIRSNENGNDSIRVNRECDSNDIKRSWSRPLKGFAGIIETDQAIQTLTTFASPDLETD
jgi:hypothetical protein